MGPGAPGERWVEKRARQEIEREACREFELRGLATTRSDLDSELPLSFSRQLL